MRLGAAEKFRNGAQLRQSLRAVGNGTRRTSGDLLRYVRHALVVLDGLVGLYWRHGGRGCRWHQVQHRVDRFPRGREARTFLAQAGVGRFFKLMDRFPIVIVLGGALLGWIAGGMVVTDVVTKDWLAANVPATGWIGPMVGAILVVVIGKTLAARAEKRTPAMEDLAATHDKSSADAGHK